MPFSGSAPNKTFSRTTGLQTGTTAWADTEAQERGIESSDHDTHDQDLAAGINTSLQRDGANKPTANIDWGGFKINNLGDPTAATDAANKQYVDDTAATVVNFTVRAASTANVNLTTDVDDGSSFDGVTLAQNDRILLKNQSTAAQNGIYVVPAAAGTATRATDMDTWTETLGAIVNVTAGSTNAGTSWRSTANSGGTIDVTSLSFVQHGTSITLPLAVTSGGTGGTSAADGFNNIKQAASTSATGVVEKATDAEVYSAATDKYVAADHIETASAFVALTDAASITFDWDAGVNRSLTIGGNRTLANPTNGQPGTWRTIRITQDGTGSRTLAFGSNYRFPGGSEPTLTSAAGSVDKLMIQCITTSIFDVHAALNMAT